MKVTSITKSLALAALSVHTLSLAGTVYKADNTTTLNTASSWVSSTLPGSGDVATWDSQVSAANTTNSLGANLTWAGLAVVNPGGPVQLNSGFNLTNGAKGINLLAATQDLILSNNIVVGVPQNWSVAPGRTLTVGAGFLKTLGGAVRFELPDSTANVLVTNAPGGLVLQNGFIPFATINDTDFAAVNSSGLIAAGNTVLTYSVNPAGNFKATTAVVDFTTSAYGLNLNGNSVVDGIRINQPNTAYSVWNVNVNSGKVLSLGALLVTTNVGAQAVYLLGGGSVRIYGNELLLFQNNLAAPVVFQSTVQLTQYAAGAALTKLGVGTVEIQSAAAYTGGTRVYEGTLQISGSGTAGGGVLNVFGGNFAGASGAVNYAPTVVYAGATNTVRISAANGQFIQASNLTLSAGAHLLFSPSNGVSLSTTAAPLVITNIGTTLYATNSVTIDIAANPAVGQYPLIKVTTLGGNGFSAFTLNLPPHITGSLLNNTANGTIDLVVTANNQPVKWAVGSGTWDVATTPNWKDATSASTTYQQNGGLGDVVVLDDTASGSSPLTINLASGVVPASVTVNATKNYVLTGNGGINGATAVTKSGTGTLTLGTTNAFSGGLNLNGGTTVFSALNQLGTTAFGGGAINFAGGTLRYSANPDDISGRTVTFGAGGATVDDGGNAITFAHAVGNGGAGGLTKLGSGTLSLNGTNVFYGNTVVGAGTLVLPSAAYISNSVAILVGSGATLDVSLNSFVLQNQILAGSGTVAGSVVATNGAVISPATNGTAGTLTINSGSLTVIGANLVLDVASAAKDLLVVNGDLSLAAGTVTLNVTGTLANGRYKLIQYSGSLSGTAANLAVAGFSQPGKIASLSDATGGEIDLVIATQSGLNKLWQGTADNSWSVGGLANWLYNSATTSYAEGDAVTFNDTAAQTSVSLLAAVNPAAVTVSNLSATYTFTDGAGGAGKISGSTGLTKKGAGTLVIDTANNNSGSTVISGGTVQVGDGSSTGDLGTGNITNNATLIFAQTDNRSVVGSISGTGTLTQQGSATLTLAANNTYSGVTLISAGTLQVGSGGAAGSLGSSTVTDNSALVVDRSDSATFANNITGSGSFASIGTGTLTLTGTLAWLGNTSVTNGTLKLGGSEKIPDAATVAGVTGVLNLEGTLDLNGYNETLNALAGTSGVVSNSADTGTSTLIIGDDADSTTFSGTIADGSNGGKLRLIKQGGSTLTLNTYNTYSGGTILSNGVVVGPTVVGGNVGLLGTGPVTFYGGTLQFGGYAGSSTTQLGVFTNTLTVLTNQTGTLLLPARGDVNSVVTGAGTLNVTVTATRGNVGGNWSAFAGNVNITAKTAVSDDFRVNSSVGFPNAKVHLGPGVNFYNLVTGAIIPVGELSGEAGSLLPIGATNTGGAQAVVWWVGRLNTSTNFNGAIIDGTGILKDGTGSWTLTGANMYTGITAVTNGTLVLANDSAASPNTSLFDLRSSTARLDVSGLTSGTLTIGASQTLQGSGTVLGSVTVSGGLSLGQTIGTLTVTNQVTLNGTAVFKLNRTNSASANDELVAKTVAAGGSLVVSNAGPDLVTGSTYQLFSVPVTGDFASVTLPTANVSGTINYVWNNRLAIDGTLVLVSGASAVNTNATPLVSAVRNGALTLNWPSDHTGWRLQAQTNAIGAGLGTNWVTIDSATTTNQISLPVNPANGAVFFRLVYP